MYMERRGWGWGGGGGVGVGGNGGKGLTDGAQGLLHLGVYARAIAQQVKVSC